MLGNSISGKDEDGNPLTEYYLSDGTVKQLVDDETATGKWVIKGEKVIKTVRREPPRRAKSPRVSASKVRPVRLSPTEVKATPTDDPSDDLDLPAEFADDLEVEPLE